MALTIIHSIASWFLRKRIDQIEEFIKRPHEVQENVCAKLLEAAQSTEMGKQYDFISIRNYEDFASRIPISIYEDIEPMIERARRGEQNLFWRTPIKWFAKSSGTTNAKSKFIPVSEEALQHCHYKAGKDMLCLYLNNNPDSNLFTGKSLRLGGSKELYEENGTIFGDLSAILIDNLPFWAAFSCTPSTKVSLMSEWEAKMKAIVAESSRENVTSLVGVPSWMMVLLRQALAYTGKENILEIWKNLEVYFHGGVSFVPYREQYKQLIPSDISMDSFGTPAQKAIPLWEVEVGKNYAMVITTNAGLWRYQIGDTVRFTSTSPYRIKITGRTKHHINVFGEELIIENTEEALKRACHEHHCSVIEYTVAPIFMQGNKSGGHEWIIEFETAPEDIEAFTRTLDTALKALNSDYEAKRYNDMTLAMPKIHIARKNLFHDWLKENDKLGGQHKIPRLSNSRDYFEAIWKLKDSN